eukprot:gnl/MRDRNA2_/MRDRNA2_69880_c0_seq1.p1 gnl/MRDRNA2_/MRDRNA2_69880_c0~~gnl/MRDRNA2_/MRDRNA2_69880_c0_seq1.p1  ORF type:complete len:282 (+),score=35.38 gnl/MRDRNA2_/MRDRNA2_69880_c0_seq1:195-1040(+)
MFKACCACRDHSENQQQITNNRPDLTDCADTDLPQRPEDTDCNQVTSQKLKLHGFQQAVSAYDPQDNSEASTSGTDHPPTLEHSETSASSTSGPSPLRIASFDARNCDDESSQGSASSRSLVPSHRSEDSLTSVGKHCRKVRLQDLVKSFVKQALQGIACSFVTDTDDFLPAKYLIDKRLQKLLMKVEGNGSLDFDTRCPFVQITGIYHPEMGEHHFPRSLRSWSYEDKSRLVMISYIDEGTSLKRLLFLLNDAYDRERFISCIKVLKQFSQAAISKERPV